MRPAASGRVIGRKLMQPRKKMVIEEEERSTITYVFDMSGIVQKLYKKKKFFFF